MPSSDRFHLVSFMLKIAFEKGPFRMTPARWRIGNPSYAHATRVAYLFPSFARISQTAGPISTGQKRGDSRRRDEASRHSRGALGPPVRILEFRTYRVSRETAPRPNRRSHRRRSDARRLRTGRTVRRTRRGAAGTSSRHRTAVPRNPPKRPLQTLAPGDLTVQPSVRDGLPGRETRAKGRRKSLSPVPLGSVEKCGPQPSRRMCLRSRSTGVLNAAPPHASGCRSRTA